MADISEKSASGSTKIVGSDSSGNETNYAKINSLGLLGAEISLTGGPQLDAFGRLRVSNPETLFQADERNTVYEDELWSTVVANSGTSTHDNNKKARVLTVTGSGDDVERRTRQYVPYVKGKSQLIYFTGNIKGAVANTEKMWGQFDDANGFYFKTDGTDFKVGIRSSTSGSVVDTEVSRASWNGDKLDGTGASGLTIDLTKQNIFIIDYGWLGTASVTFAVYIDRAKHVVHTIHNANMLDTLYSQMGTLPIGAKLSSTGGSTTLEMTCYSVQAEGGDSLRGKIRAIDTGIAGFSVSGTAKVAAALRLQSAHNRASIKPLKFDLTVNSGNKDVYWKLLFNPTITGGTWGNVPNSIAESNGTATGFSGGVVIDSGYVNVGSTGKTIITDIDNALGRDISGNSDTLALIVQTISGSGAILFSGSWREDV